MRINLENNNLQELQDSLNNTFLDYEIEGAKLTYYLTEDIKIMFDYDYEKQKTFAYLDF